jgi:hypothetical protein
MIAPTFCPLCLAANVVATATGPTCSHTAGWFPADWSKMGEAARLAWIANNNNPKVQHGR